MARSSKSNEDDANQAEQEQPPASQPAVPPSEENSEQGGAMSATQQAMNTEASQDALNPAFAAPEVQEQIKKEWEGGAEHTVDAEQVVKEEEKNQNS